MISEEPGAGSFGSGSASDLRGFMFGLGGHLAGSDDWMLDPTAAAIPPAIETRTDRTVRCFVFPPARLIVFVCGVVEKNDASSCKVSDFPVAHLDFGFARKIEDELSAWRQSPYQRGGAFNATWVAVTNGERRKGGAGGARSTGVRLTATSSKCDSPVSFEREPTLM